MTLLEHNTKRAKLVTRIHKLQSQQAQLLEKEKELCARLYELDKQETEKQAKLVKKAEALQAELLAVQSKLSPKEIQQIAEAQSVIDTAEKNFSELVEHLS